MTEVAQQPISGKAATGGFGQEGVPGSAISGNRMQSSHQSGRPMSNESAVGVDIDQQSISQPKQVLEVQRKLLAKAKNPSTHPIADKNAFDTVGSNGIFQASPSVLRFAGFEANKTHTLKLRIVNNSPAPQRLHVLPPQTPYFKIRFNKKGMLPTGVSEDIYVQFTPTGDQPYRYYYDSVRIHCEGDKLLVPIHAYTLINAQAGNQFPSRIDMGQGCALGKTYNKSVHIVSNCPVSFDYEMGIVKSHPEIQIISPMMGEITGMQTTEIAFSYTPKTFATAEAEITVRTTEFDSEMHTIRIVGNAAPTKDGDRKMIGASMAGSMVEASQSEGKTLLTASKNYNPQMRLKKIGSKGDTLNDQTALTAHSSSELAKPSGVLELKSVKLSEEEQNFIKEYRQLEEVEREKGIKFFRCIGDEPHTQEFVAGVDGKRADKITTEVNAKRDEDCHRYTTEIDRDRVVVDTDIGKALVAAPKWDVFENNHFSMRRRLVSIFLTVSNRLICRMRAGKRLQKLKHWISGNGIRTREDMRRKVAEDFKLAQTLRVGADDTEQDNVMNVRFTFGFNEFIINEDMQKLPLQYENNMASFLEKIETNPPANFDDMVPYDELEELEFEKCAYKELPVPQMSCYDPAFRSHAKKPGCEYESVRRQMGGEPDLEKAQKRAHEQMELLKQEKKDVVSAAIVNMPQGFLKPCHYSTDLLLKAAQHPTLRAYVSQAGTTTTEIDPEFNLYPCERQRNETHDEIQIQKQSLAKEIKQHGYQPVSENYNLQPVRSSGGTYYKCLDLPTSLLPGNFGARVLDNMMPTDLSHVHRDRRSTLTQSLVCEAGPGWQVPNLLQRPEKTDYLTDDESDEGAGFELKIPALEELINEFEVGDEVMIGLESSIKDRQADLASQGLKPETRDHISLVKKTKSDLLENNIEKQRNYESANFASKLQEFNSVIATPSHRVFLR